MKVLSWYVAIYAGVRIFVGVLNGQLDIFSTASLVLAVAMLQRL